MRNLIWLNALQITPGCVKPVARNVERIYGFGKAASARRGRVVRCVRRKLSEQQALAVALGFENLRIVASAKKLHRVNFGVDKFFSAKLDERHLTFFAITREGAIGDVNQARKFFVFKKIG